MEYRPQNRQHGITLVGLIFVFSILGMLAVLGLKVLPTVTEYMSINKAIFTAKAAGTTVHDVQASFNKQAEINYIDSIKGEDLEITKDGEEMEVSFAYEKRIPLVGPVSLVIDYAGTTSKTAPKKAAE